MKKKRMSFVNNPSPVLAGVVREKCVRSAIAKIKNCELHGADVIDLHLSCLEDGCKNAESIQQIVEASNLPILALNYNSDYEYRGFETDEETRVELLLRAVRGGAAAIDIQGYTYDLYSKQNFRKEYESSEYSFTKGNPKEIVMDEQIIQKQIALIEKVHGMGAEVLLSTHPNIPMNTQQVVELALFLEKRNPDIIKIVTPCNTEEELAEAFKTMLTLKREVKTKTSFHCSGKAGKLSRMINPLLGAYLIFCNDEYSISSNFEQIDLQTARSILDNMKKIM